MKVCFGLLIVACAITNSSSQYRFNFNTRGRQSGSGLGGSLFDLFNPSGFFSSHLQQAQKYLASASGNRKQYRYPGRDTSGSVSKKPVVDKGPEHSHKEKEKHGHDSHGKPPVLSPVHKTAHVETDPECVEACLIAEEAKVAPEKCHCAAHICDHVKCSAGSSCRLVTVGGITEGSCLPMDSSGQVLGQTIGVHDISGCGLPLNQGSPCPSSPSTRFYFDIERQACFSFQYTGCAGNKNNYNSLFQCEGFCTNQHIAPGIIDHHNTPGLIPGGHHNEPGGHHNEPSGHHNEPLGHHNEPLGHHNEPAGHHNEPGVILGGHHNEPAGHHNEPTGHHNEPAGHHHEPGVIDHHGVIPGGFPPDNGVPPRTSILNTPPVTTASPLTEHECVTSCEQNIAPEECHCAAHLCDTITCPVDTACRLVTTGGLVEGSCLPRDSTTGEAPGSKTHGISGCGLPLNEGSICARAPSTRYYFNVMTQECSTFAFSGCGGNINNFHGAHECQDVCMNQHITAGIIDHHNSPGGGGAGSNLIPIEPPGHQHGPGQPIESGSDQECLVGCEHNVAPERCHCSAHLCDIDKRVCSPGTVCLLVTQGGLVEGTCLPKDSPEGQTPEEFMHMHRISGCGLSLNRGSTCALPSSTRFYFDRNRQSCFSFQFNGCGGNDNSFKTASTCEEVCMKQHISTGIIDHHNAPGAAHGGSPLDHIEPLGGHGPHGHEPHVDAHGPTIGGLLAPHHDTHGPNILGGHDPHVDAHGGSPLGGHEPHVVAEPHAHGPNIGGHSPHVDAHGPNGGGLGPHLDAHGPNIGGLLSPHVDTHGASIDGHGPHVDAHEKHTAVEAHEAVCGLARERGTQCTSNGGRRVRMYYFDNARKRCRRFGYTGCGGNANRFPTREACFKKCQNPRVATASRLSDPRLPPVLRLFGGGGGIRGISHSTNLFRNSRPDQRSRAPTRSIFGLPMNNIMSQFFSRPSTGTPFSFGLTSLNGNRPRYAGYRPRALASGKATKQVAPPADKY